MADFNQIILAIFMVIVVIFVIFFFTSNKSIANEILVKFNIIQPTIETSTLSEEEALILFNNITNIYNNCIESNDKICTCTKKTFPGFEEFPRLRSRDTLKVQGSGLNTIIWFENKDEEQLDQSNFKGVLNCFLTSEKDNNGNYKTIIEDEPFFINFDDPRRIYIKKQLTTQKDYIYFVDDAPVLFKDSQGNICFATERFLLSGITTTVKKETKNYLNSLNFCFPSNKKYVISELQRISNLINNCKNNNDCGTFTLNLPEDYTILHRNNGAIGAYYLDISGFNLVSSFIALGSYCYTDQDLKKKYNNGDTLRLEKKGTRVCLGLSQIA